MNRVIVLCCSLIVFSSMQNIFSYSQKHLEMHENQIVKKIIFLPQKSLESDLFDPKIVASKLKTQEKSIFSQNTFDADLKLLADDYDHVDTEFINEDGGLVILVKVWPKPIINNIIWEGCQKIKAKDLQKKLGVSNSSILDRPSFNKAFNELKEYYIKKGYFESELSYKIIPDPLSNKVDIVIQVNEGRLGLIQEIIFKGFSKEEQSLLSEMIYTKKHNLFLSWLSNTGTYKEEAAEHDRLSIVTFLQNRGYADAEIKFAIKESVKSGKIILEIIANKGELFRFGKVTFKGNVFMEDEEIRKRFQVHPETLYSTEKLYSTIEAIKHVYGSKGYIETDVQYETILRENEPIYDVVFTIEEGSKYKIGLIKILGNKRTHTNVILRESLLTPGQLFSGQRLKATQERLLNIGYFKNVNVYAARSEDDTFDEAFRDVYIEVEEKSTGNIGFSFGYSENDFYGSLDLSESNFNYKGIPQILKKGLHSLRGGGEYAHLKATFGEKQKVYSFSWMTPYFRDTLWRTGFDISKSIGALQSEHYEMKSYGSSIFAGYPLNSLWSINTRYRIRHSQTNLKTHELERDIRKQGEKHGLSDDDIQKRLALKQLYLQETNTSGLISGLSSSLIFDSTDNPIKARKGFRSLLEAELVGLGGKYHFMKLGYINTYYAPLWPRGTVKYRFDTKFIQPFGSIVVDQDETISQDLNKKKLVELEKAVPFSERFFLGGENSIRGYKPFSIGPKMLNNPQEPKGGLSSTLLSVEYSHAAFKMVDLFLFADAGTLQPKPFRIHSWLFSWGYGMRIDLLNRVPFMLGWGHPVNDKKNEKIFQRFFFSMGGQF
ncbi:MAG: outer membrane protein assembly factor BamA [Rhabdochlamydiaceae bacterium]